MFGAFSTPATTPTTVPATTPGFDLGGVLTNTLNNAANLLGQWGALEIQTEIAQDVAQLQNIQNQVAADQAAAQNVPADNGNVQSNSGGFAVPEWGKTALWVGGGLAAVIVVWKALK